MRKNLKRLLLAAVWVFASAGFAFADLAPSPVRTVSRLSGFLIPAVIVIALVLLVRAIKKRK